MFVLVIVTWLLCRDILDNLKANDGIDSVTSALIDNEGDVDVVVVFSTGKVL